MSRLCLAAACAVLFALGCDRYDNIDAPPNGSALDVQLRQQLGNWGTVPIGEQPPVDSALFRLGQALMFDKELSGNRDVSCASCHDPAAHLADGRSLAVGTGAVVAGGIRTLGPGRQISVRSAPSLLNQGLRAYELFWDGRVEGFGAGPFRTPAGNQLPAMPDILAAQAMFPVTNRQEMRGNPGDVDRFGAPNELAPLGDTQFTQIWAAVMARLMAIPGYQQMFQAAFPGQASFSFRHAATAIAAFETAAFTKTRSPFDRYLAHDDAALTDEQKRGALLFFGRARCSQCHNGPLLGGQSFANVGVPQVGPGNPGAAPLDFGRGALPDSVIGGPPADFYRFAFRVPQLRNVELTAPYFHDGAYPTLEAVVKHYNNVPQALAGYDPTQLEPSLRGLYHGDAQTIADITLRLDPRIAQPNNLTDAEMKQVVAFLRSLTDPSARNLSSLIPASVPSGLPVGN